MKRDKSDILFSKMIRERDNWTCQMCGKYFPEDASRQGLHCSHIYSRRHLTVRWEPYNAVAHCFTCHQRFGGSPVFGGQWAREHLGDSIIDLLEERHRVTVKQLTGAKLDRVALHKHLLSEYKRLMDCRKKGDISRVHLVGFI